jgi:hypothetical protein
MKTFPLIVTVSAQKDMPIGYKLLKKTTNGDKIVIRTDSAYMAESVA